MLEVSQKIPLCIVSSKDFAFLSRRIKFARAFSCILGIETILFSRSGVESIKVLNGHKIRQNTEMLVSITERIESSFKDLSVERKFTSDGLLAGVTIDWRHAQEWRSYKTEVEPQLKEIIFRESTGLFVQLYDSHPFIDVYAIECDKGIAFDSLITVSKLKGGILYLGDSENDNPAFRKADVSIGIRSDKRLNPRLDCNYLIDFNQLPALLKKLEQNDFVVDNTHVTIDHG